GAILVGKTQTHEFAWGITSVNLLLGTSRNPWSPDRISGGSSGGSAVALAAHLVPLALGSDTGGSIRVPAAFCGTVGLKPTYGRISAAGVFPLARSLDHPGPMARTPGDAALLLSVTAGVDPDDPGTEGVPVGEPARSFLAGLEGVRVGLCPDRQRLRAGFARLFQRADLLLTPVSAGPPLPIGEERLVHLGRELEFRELVMTYTVPQDLAGLPACTVRAGFDELGIPVGVQFTGPPWSEGLVLRAANALYTATEELQRRWPELALPPATPVATFRS